MTRPMCGIVHYTLSEGKGKNNTQERASWVGDPHHARCSLELVIAPDYTVNHDHAEYAAFWKLPAVLGSST